MRVLVAEDRRVLADTIARGLRREGMAVDVVYDGAAASELAAANPYDVVVLDRDLPAVHGDDVCRELAAGQPGPSRGGPRVLMLTASGTVSDRIRGLNLGADDYLPKPFDFDELVARIRALMRRSQPALAPVLSYGGVKLDPARRRVTRDGEPILLTPKEFGVLELLLAAGGAVVSQEDLLERVWDENADPFTNAVRVTLMTLRKKLGDPPLIETVRGVGYRI
jgi:DNA-binding response OmpR family regulator